jgi:hypothetical protein
MPHKYIVQISTNPKKTTNTCWGGTHNHILSLLTTPRAYALCAPVFLGSLTRKTRGFAPPPAHRSFAAPLFIICIMIYQENHKNLSLEKNPRTTKSCVPQGQSRQTYSFSMFHTEKYLESRSCQSSVPMMLRREVAVRSSRNRAAAHRSLVWSTLNIKVAIIAKKN